MGRDKKILKVVHSHCRARFLRERTQRYENCLKWAGSIRTAGARGTDYSSGRKIQRYKNAESRRIVQQKRDSDKEQRRYLHGYWPALGLASRKWRGREDLPEDQTCDRRTRP